ncbi:unnamed protein product, partial [Ectocarpus sp. 12 AP-2014]
YFPIFFLWLVFYFPFFCNTYTHQDCQHRERVTSAAVKSILAPLSGTFGRPLIDTFHGRALHPTSTSTLFSQTISADGRGTSKPSCHPRQPGNGKTDPWRSNCK